MNAAVAVLIIAYVMPGRLPDVMLQLDEPSLAACWTEAMDFVDHGMPDAVKDHGAVGVYAGCKVKAEYTVRD